MKKVLIISSSMRIKGNSDMLADAFMKGAKRIGHQVEKVNLSNSKIQYCSGCLICQKTGKCPLQDDMNDLLEKMVISDVIVFATPVYFYEMCGQMKTFLDRTNPLYDTNYQFRNIYLLASAAEDDKGAMDGAVQGLQGWISCFPNTSLSGVVYGTGLKDSDDILRHSALLQEAMDMGSNI